MRDEDIRSYNILKRYKVVGIVNRLIILKDSGIKAFIKSFKRKKVKTTKEIRKTPLKINFKEGYIDIIIEKNEYYETLKELSRNYKINFFTLDKNKNNECKNISELELNNIFINRSFIIITDKEKDMSDFFYGKNFIYKDELTNKIEKYIKSTEGLKLIANYDTKNNVTVKTSTFFDANGTNYYSGGAERYLIDLYEIFKEMGLNMDIYQNANNPYFRKYNNINVIGLSLKNFPLTFNLNYLEKQTKNYINETRMKSILHIYSAFQECYPNHIGPSIGISHGISWDSKRNKYTNGTDFWNQNKLFIEGAKLCDRLVSVDTNTANWFQTIDFDLGNRKFSVIPNYVDTNEFTPRKDYLEKRDKIVITYPRRLYEPRGLYITLGIVDEILEKYDNVEFHFVGKGFDEDVKHIEEKIKKYPGKVFCYSKSPFEMHEVYKMSDISLIPTQYSEGTSLSCLEALASGNIVVSTRIGGLTDLVLNGYNGYLIEPDSKSLLKTIEKILNNYDDHKEMKKHAIEVAKKFNKQEWKEKWKNIINEMNIKGESKTIDLIEFYVKNANDLKENTLNLIRKEIENGHLVYIKSEIKVKNDKITGNLIQLVPFDEEVVSEAKKIYVEKECSKKIKDAEIIK